MPVQAIVFTNLITQKITFFEKTFEIVLSELKIHDIIFFVELWAVSSAGRATDS
ncbi:hypothetical protein AWV72_01905 [Lactiplantibacillus plantarum]|nr:hypothetical protein AWV72_01905 [Lactiplantibacillus plantarum]